MGQVYLKPTIPVVKGAPLPVSTVIASPTPTASTIKTNVINPGVDVTKKPWYQLAKLYSDNKMPINQDAVLAEYIADGDKGDLGQAFNPKTGDLYKIAVQNRTLLAQLDMPVLEMVEANVKWDTNLTPPIKQGGALGFLIGAVGGFLAGGPIGAVIGTFASSAKDEKARNSATAQAEAEKVDYLTTVGLDNVIQLRGDGIPNNDIIAANDNALASTESLLNFKGKEMWILSAMILLIIVVLIKNRS